MLNTKTHPQPAAGAAVSSPVSQEISPLQSWRRITSHAGQWWTVGVLVVLVLIFAALEPRFLSRESWLATSEFAVEFLLLGIGQTLVIVTAGIDLSVGAILGSSAMMSALVMQRLLADGVSGWATVAVGLLVSIVAGALIGALNGVLITKLKLAPFIVTLGTLTAFGGGVVFLLNNGTPISDVPPELASIGTTVWLGWLPVPVVIAAVLALIFALVLSRSRFGLRTYAIGSDETAARRSGINVSRHLILVYMLSGLLAGIAGFIVTARFNNAAPIAGAHDELYAIAAAVIGGASLFGGRGTILGTVVGAFTIAVLTTGLVILGILPFWQPVAIGAVVIIAVAVDQARARRSAG